MQIKRNVLSMNKKEIWAQGQFPRGQMT